MSKCRSRFFDVAEKNILVKKTEGKTENKFDER